MKQISNDLFFRTAPVPKVFSKRALKKEYGFLKSLAGKWSGDKGWNIISVPIPGSTDPLDFKVLIQPYIEDMEFKKVTGGVPNRGKKKTQINFAVKYDLSVRNKEHRSIGLHEENGMFLNQTVAGKNQIVRQSIIPHGNSVLALGDGTFDSGNPIEGALGALNAIFSPFPKSIKPPNLTGYGSEVFPRKVKEALAQIDPKFVGNFNPFAPINSLLEDTKKQNILNTITLDLNTEPDGGIVNTPFIVENANTPDFRSIFWIQEVEVDGGVGSILQMQYAQVSSIIFPTSGKTIINWPHININTLVKTHE